MKYDKKIFEGVEIINNSLKGLKEFQLLGSPDFLIDRISHENYLKVDLKKSNCIDLSIIITLDGIQFNIDRMEDGIEWSYSQFEKSPNEIINLIKIIFTSEIQVQYCGAKYTRLLFNQNHECVKTIKAISGLYLKINCKTKNYPPIYKI